MAVSMAGACMPFNASVILRSSASIAGGSSMLSRSGLKSIGGYIQRCSAWLLLATNPINAFAEPGQGLALGAVGSGRGGVVGPAGAGRQAHENTLGAAAGFETEAGAAVESQVELGISGAAQGLPGCFTFAVGEGVVFGHEAAVERPKQLGYVAHEGE